MTAGQKSLGRILRALGFKLESKHVDLITYVRVEVGNTRSIDVQLWADDRHRVSSEVRSLDGWSRRHSAHPTSFETALEMLSAIATQQVVEHP